MDIDGFNIHGTFQLTDAFRLFLADEVSGFLRKQGAGANRQHVKKIGHTFDNIRRSGLRGVHNSTLFVSEGKFSSGQAGMADLSVYAVKAFQLRVYGGLVTYRGEKIFICPEATVKKRDLADRAQLERVAKILGGYHER